MNNIAHCCFWVERSVSSWERFLSENLWDINAVGRTLVILLLQKLENQLQVHGGYLAGLDTLLVPKNGKKMSGVQLVAFFFPSPLLTEVPPYICTSKP